MDRRAAATVIHMTTPDDVVWAFHPDRDAWEQAGFETWEETAPWIAAKWTPTDAAGWRLVADPNQAAAWQSVDVDPAEMVAWTRTLVADTVTPAEVQRWKAAGFRTPAMAEWWRRFPQWENNPEAATPWDKHFSANMAHGWYAAGFDPESAHRWDQEGFNAVAASEWRDRGLSPKDARRWVQHEFGPTEAGVWATRTTFNPREAQLWRDAGRSIEDAKSAGFGR